MTRKRDFADEIAEQHIEEVGSAIAEGNPDLLLAVLRKIALAGAAKAPPATEACDPDIFERGKQVAVSAIRPMFADAWCAWVKREAGLVVDWSYFGGRNVFRTLGDVSLAAPFLPMLKAMERGEFRKSTYQPDEKPEGT